MTEIIPQGESKPHDIGVRRAIEQMKLSALGAVELVVGAGFYSAGGVVMHFLIRWATPMGLSSFDRFAISILQIVSAAPWVAHGLLNAILGLRLAYLAFVKDWKGGR
jgi:hypothetical protein